MTKRVPPYSPEMRARAAKYLLLVERYALRPDLGGAGTFRGGLGTEQIVQARADIRF
jgi:N-methylhydantoinase B